MGNEEGGWLTAKFTVQSLRKEFPRRFKGAVVTIFVQLKEYIFHPKSFDSNIRRHACKMLSTLFTLFVFTIHEAVRNSRQAAHTT